MQMIGPSMNLKERVSVFLLNKTIKHFINLSVEGLID